MNYSDISDEMELVVLGKTKFLMENITIFEFTQHRPKTTTWPRIALVQVDKWDSTKLLDIYSYHELCSEIIRHRKAEPDIIDDFGLLGIIPQETCK